MKILSSCFPRMDGMNIEAKVLEIEHNCPCRKQQIAKLAELFGTQDEFACPNIFVHGNTSTGKSHVLANMLEILKLTTLHHNGFPGFLNSISCELPAISSSIEAGARKEQEAQKLYNQCCDEETLPNLNHVIMNCVECYSSRLLYETILDAVHEQTHLKDRSWTKCDNMNDFLRHFKHLLSLLQGTFVIIFEKAERLRKMDVQLLSAVLRLHEFIKSNLCVVLVTEIAWEKFLCGTCFPVPVVVHFNNYNQNELIEIMCLDCPDGYTREFYASYCRLLVSVFHLACRDLDELRHLALLNFPKYCEPLAKDSGTDLRRLWRNIEPHLKKCLSTVYLGQISTMKWEQMQQRDASETSKPKAPLELPYFSKYLIIAAYFASHNPSRTDRRFFCKRTYGKMSKRAKTAVKKTAADEKITGPKAFPLDRLMAIFYSILDDDIESNSSILTQVSTLVTLNLIAKVSADDQIDSAKYKCLVSLDFINAIADNISFDLAQYMHEEA